MPSPFPGMDPYLESPSLWADFHLTMIVAIRAELNRLLPEKYVASADRYVWLHLAAPVTMMLPGVREKGSPYLKIVDREHRRLVTVVEMLSPANKQPGKDREAYLLKRGEYLANGVNLVELDLLRRGERAPFGDHPPPRADYYVLVCRASEMPQAGVWPLSVRDLLPTVPVPLHPPDADVELALKPCLDRVYDEAAYRRELNYSQPPQVALTEPDATWARVVG